VCFYPLRGLLVPILQTTIRNRIEQLVTYVLCLALHIAWNQHDGGDMVALKEIPITESDLSQDMFELDMTASIWSDLEPMPPNDGPEPLCPILYDPECTFCLPNL